MGSDFLWTTMPDFPDGATDAELCKQLRDQLKQISADHIYYVCDTFGYLIEDDDDPGNWVPDLDMLEQRIREAVELLHDDRRRDTSTILMYDKFGSQHWHLITGGMSGGDSPTEAFEQIDFLNELYKWDFPWYCEAPTPEQIAEVRQRLEEYLKEPT